VACAWLWCIAGYFELNEAFSCAQLFLMRVPSLQPPKFLDGAVPLDIVRIDPNLERTPTHVRHNSL
jgi:hypothetical protein